MAAHVVYTVVHCATMVISAASCITAVPLVCCAVFCFNCSATMLQCEGCCMLTVCVATLAR